MGWFATIARWFRPRPDVVRPGQVDGGEMEEAADGGPVWCVVANVVMEREYGPGGAELRRGTKHFVPGAKVYVFSFYWGMGGERVTVVGRHRKSRRYIRLTMAAKHLANWRAELVYSPYVIKQIRKEGEFAAFPPNSEEGRRRAEEIAAGYVKRGGSRSRS